MWLKALRQAGSRNAAVKLGPYMFVHMCLLYDKVKQKIQFACSSLVSIDSFVQANSAF